MYRPKSRVSPHGKELEAQPFGLWVLQCTSSTSYLLNKTQVKLQCAKTTWVLGRGGSWATRLHKPKLHCLFIIWVSLGCKFILSLIGSVGSEFPSEFPPHGSRFGLLFYLTRYSNHSSPSGVHLEGKSHFLLAQSLPNKMVSSTHLGDFLV